MNIDDTVESDAVDLNIITVQDVISQKGEIKLGQILNLPDANGDYLINLDLNIINRGTINIAEYGRNNNFGGSYYTVTQGFNGIIL